MADDKLKTISVCDDENSDWLHKIINPETGKSYKEEDVEVHKELAKKYKLLEKVGKKEK